MKYTMRKTMALGLAGLTLLSCLAGCGANTAEPETDAPADEAAQVAEAAISLLPTHSSSAGKEETVYVIADAEGNPTETIVSAWLKNPDGADTITDSTELSNIVNVKGNETFTAGADGNVTWAAQGSDIYYQGTTDKVLPVTTAITYVLDGRTVPATELAGADGHLVITFDYTNNTATETTVDGKRVTLYQPFLVVSGLMLDGDRAENVTVTHGKVISTGDRSIVVGMAMPGLKESLGLDELEDGDGEPVDIDIPESVTIEADVTDFELLTTVTVIENSLLSDLDLEDVETIDDLKDSLAELTDASTQLVDGTADLHDGVEELSDKLPELTDGIDKLDSGAQDLKSGADTLSSGADKVSSGAADLADGASDLADGNAALKQGARALDDGAGSLADGAKQVSAGAAALSAGAQDLSAGIGQMKTQVADLPDGVNKLYNGTLLVKAALKGGDGQSVYEGAAAIESGADALYAGLMGDGSIYEGAGAIASGADAIESGADSISGAASSVKAGLEAVPGTIASAVGDAQNGLSAAISALDGISFDGVGEEQAAAIMTAVGTAKAYINGVSDGLSGVDVDLSQATGALDAIASGAGDIASGAAAIESGAYGIQDGASALGGGAAQISAGAAALEGGIDQIVSDENLGAIIDGLNTLNESSQALVDGVDQLSDGADTLSSGASSLADGASGVSDGAATLKDGTAALKSGAASAASGAAALSAGADTLADGASQLSGGADSLADGAAQIKDGTGQLKDGGATLTDGVAQLLDGARELMDGMAEFDEEGIQKLSELFEDDAQELIDRLRAVQALGEEYTSFAGTGGASGSVQFIIRTESIEK